MRHPRYFLYTLLSVAIGAGACSGNEATPFEAQTPSYSLTDLTSSLLVKCSEQTYTSKVVVVGPDGGTLVLGPHTLVIPAGALKKPVSIMGEVISGKVNSVRFKPEGLQFAQSAALTLSYSNCRGLGMATPKKIAYTDELLSILSIIRSVDLESAQKVVGRLDHFSRYAVAY